MLKVSILMNCLNGEHYVRGAIDSIYAQTHQDWEIIFIDNASSDNSALIAKSYDERLKYYNTGKTIPLYAARNFGLQYVSGQFVAFLDVDDSWHPTKLSQQLAMMKKYSSVYLICSGYFRINEQLQKTSRYTSYRSKFISFLNALNHYPVALSTTLLRYDDISKTKIQFEPTLNLTGDYELFLKLIYQFKALFIGDPLVTFRVHTKNLSAKLVQDWPKELEETHARLMSKITLSTQEKNLLDKRYVRTCSLVYLAGKDYKNVRRISKRYLLRDAKISLIYLSTYIQSLAKWFLKIRGF